MTEETNGAAAAAAEPAPEAEAARAVTQDPPNPPDPIPDPPSGATSAATDEAELDRIANQERERALTEDQARGTDEADPNADTQVNEELREAAAPPSAILVPNVGISQRVFLRLEQGGPFATAALVTAYDRDTGVANVTAFPDGEVPRPISGVPYFENAPEATKAWQL
jgi:hypothetical protein